jgi:hypothetical protein
VIRQTEDQPVERKYAPLWREEDAVRALDPGKQEDAGWHDNGDRERFGSRGKLGDGLMRRHSFASNMNPILTNLVLSPRSAR